MEGYREGFLLRGLPIDESLICYGDYTVRSGFEAAAELGRAGATAVIACNEKLAYGVYEYAAKYASLWERTFRWSALRI